MNHRFIGKREYGLIPKPDDKCVQCDVRYASHTSVVVAVDEDQLAKAKGELLALQVDHFKMATKVMLAELDFRNQEQRADSFRDQAGKLYDIRGWLRLCENTPEGHAEFYYWASKIIFPESDDNGEPHADYPPSLQDGNPVQGQGQAGE